jgi:hypothetical protein
MKTKDQQLLEEAYDRVAKMVAGSNNPGWDPERPFTSGQAFKPWEPPGGWPKKTETVVKKTAAAPKKKEKSKEKLDAKGGPVSTHQYIPEPPPEEDHTASMMYISNADLEKIYHTDEQTFELLFKDSEAAVEQDGGIVFRYIAPQFKQKMQQKIQSLI